MTVHVAVMDPLPVFRRGVAAALSSRGHVVEEPADAVAWLREHPGGMVLLTLHSAEDLHRLTALCRRERLLASRQVGRAAVEQLIRLLMTDRAEPAELAARLTGAGLTPGRYAAVAATMTSAPDGPLACAVLEELLAPLTYPAHAAAIDDEAVGLVPVPLEPAQLSQRLRDQARFLESGLDGYRLTVGVSLPADAPAGLPTALHEARQARRLAEHRPGRIALLATDEIDSHPLLLATVPPDVRQTFREGVLGPIVDYDARHHTDLIPILRAFLDASGSWTHCAEHLHVHVNTLRYRIQRIEELTGRSLATLETRVDFFLALRST